MTDADDGVIGKQSTKTRFSCARQPVAEKKPFIVFKYSFSGAMSTSLAALGNIFD